jgi:riboflavin kinase/FMN adenylyltransferase
MRTIDWKAFARGEEPVGPFAAAIGVFDGIHLGHRELIGRIVGKPGLAGAVVTFAENPKRFLHGPAFPGDILTLRQRARAIGSLGADVLVLIDFSGDFGKLPGREFLSILSEAGMRYLAVGHDFRCGHRLDTGADEIRDFCAGRGIGVDFIRAVRVAGHPVSSSRIRRAISEARLEEAAALMGRPFELDLEGAARESGGRIRTAGGQAFPPSGTYEVVVVGGGLETSVEATFSEGAWTIGSRAEEPLEALRLLKMVSRV